MTFKSPVYSVKAVPIEQIESNDYNPNQIATPEMKLLYTSIKEDGYTMPIVCFYDQNRDKYIIVDGFHRYSVMLHHKDIYKREKGLLPVVVINKDLSNRIVSTIRHNRARGNHIIELMSHIVAELSNSGMSDAWILKHLGMDREELLRLKQVSGIASLFKDEEFSKAWDLNKLPILPVASVNDVETDNIPDDATNAKTSATARKSQSAQQSLLP